MICCCRWRSLSRLGVSGLLACLAVAGLGWPGGAAAHDDSEYGIIASPGVPVEGLTVAELRRLFLFNQRYWSRDLPVRILFMERDLRNGSFALTHIYHMDEAGLRRYILNKIYAGEIDRAPRVVSSPDALLQYVASGQGVLAIVRVSEIGGSGVKLLPLNGSLPGEPGYPLGD